jgi:hypothetical protein
VAQQQLRVGGVPRPGEQQRQRAHRLSYMLAADLPTCNGSNGRHGGNGGNKGNGGSNGWISSGSSGML